MRLLVEPLRGSTNAAMQPYNGTVRNSTELPALSRSHTGSSALGGGAYDFRGRVASGSLAARANSAQLIQRRRNSPRSVKQRSSTSNGRRPCREMMTVHDTPPNTIL